MINSNFPLQYTVRPALFGLVAAVAALSIATRYFPGHESMAACAFIAIGLGTYMHELLDFNRRVIWGQEMTPAAANRKLALEIGSIFVGVFTAAFFAHLLLNSSSSFGDLSKLYRNEISPLFLHNLKVLIVSLLLAFVYRAGGLILILSWNALGWADAITFYVSATIDASGAWSGILLALALLPHLFLEAFSYVLGGMGGVFLSKAFGKYHLSSKEFAQVLKACSILFLIALMVLGCSVLIEVLFAQPLYHSLVGLV